jgi:ABC-2 type transport system permease protein
MPGASPVLMIARVELLRRVRNRSAIITAFIGPLVLAVVFGVLINGSREFSTTIGVVDADGSALTSSFVEALTSQDDSSVVTFAALPDEATARARMDDDDLGAAIVIPAGFGAAATSGGDAAITVLRDPSREVSGAVARSVATRFTDGIRARAVLVGTVLALGGTPPSDTELAAIDLGADTVRTEAPGGHELDPAAFFGVSMSILFLFFTVAFAARSLIAERNAGVVPRMLASGAAPGAIVAGKVLAVCALALAGFATVWAVTSLVFGASWGDPVTVVLLMVATVLAVGGVATFVCGLARTEQQADSYTAVVSFVLALLGGNFVGPADAPAALQRMATFTPNGQALAAFTKASVDGAGPAGVASHVAVLLAIAGVFGVIGLARARAVVQR